MRERYISQALGHLFNTTEGKQMITVRLATSSLDFKICGRLIRDYVEWLDLDLSFQGLEQELGKISEKYRPPSSAMFLAYDSEKRCVGCCGVIPASAALCELKRLYVVPSARGLGAGHALISAALNFAKEAGYQKIVLDTLPKMKPALKLYASLGFGQTSKYNDNPFPEALFFEKVL